MTGHHNESARLPQTPIGDSALQIIKEHGLSLGEQLYVTDTESEFPTLARSLGRQTLLAAADTNSSGSFKVRGALVGMSLSNADSFIVPSAGNAARGAAVAARRLDRALTAVVPMTAPYAKREGIMNVWPRGRLSVITHGTTFEEVLMHAKTLQDEHWQLLHPFDDEAVIAGQGTIVDDILAQEPSIEHIVLPTGGGGLVAGIVNRLHELQMQHIVVHPVELAGSDSLSRSLRAGELQQASHPNQVCPGLAVEQIGRRCLEVLQRAGYDGATIVTVDVEEVQNVAQEYESDRREQLVTTPPYEPTSLVAMAGLRRVVKERGLRGTIVAIATGHNAPITDLFPPARELRSRVGHSPSPLLPPWLR